MKHFLVVCFLLFTHPAIAQDEEFKDFSKEMEPIPLFSERTPANIKTNELLLQLERDDFMQEMQLLNSALSKKDLSAYDSLRNKGHFDYFSEIEDDGRSKFVTYCLCAGHRQENFELALKDDRFKRIKELYSSDFFRPSGCGCATLDYVPTSAVRNAAYYQKIIDKVFKTHGEKLARYKWTPETYKAWESKQKNSSNALLANTRKTFLYYIRQNYGVTFN